MRAEKQGGSIALIMSVSEAPMVEKALKVFALLSQTTSFAGARILDKGAVALEKVRDEQS